MKQIIIGLSGGVDSACAAVLLKREGYEVIGVTVHTGFGADLRELSASVAAQLGIRHLIADVSEDFRGEVVDRFVSEYRRGRTPNPCVLCNPSVKWRALAEEADRLGIRELATGHYGRVLRLPNGRYAVEKAPYKDQSYFLCGLSQEQLARTRMVLSGMTKEEVRALAREEGLFVESRPDSQEICFIPDGDYAAFIEELTGIPSLPGHFVDADGHVLGTHKGLIRYTVGQRKGLGLSFGEPRFVTELRPETNEVVLGRNEDCFADGFLAEAPVFQQTDGSEARSGWVDCQGKIRYAHREAPCRLQLREDGLAECWFAEPQRAITPGQTAVWYRDGLVYGGATVTEVLRR